MSEVTRVQALCDVDLYHPLKKGEIREYPAALAAILIQAGFVTLVPVPRKTTKGGK